MARTSGLTSAPRLGDICGKSVTDANGTSPEPGPCPTDAAVALIEACPCDGKVLANGSVQPWRNHGQYVSCVVRLRNQLRKAGCLSDEMRRTVARCAARSTCGKTSVVRCCVSDTGTCNDPTPGDAMPAGVCSNDAARPCDVDADCTGSLVEPRARGHMPGAGRHRRERQRLRTVPAASTLGSVTHTVTRVV